MMPSSAQIVCKRCGAMVPVNRMYCDECGTQVEHDLNEVRSSVDAENRIEKIRNLGKTVRWFLAASLVLSIGGCYFRRAYRDLPHNDLVAFANAPTFGVGAECSVQTDQFDVSLPGPREPAKPAAVEDPNLDAKLIDEGLKRELVVVRKRGQNRGTEVLLIGDTVFFVPVAGQPEPVPVHLADVRRMRPLGGDRWEIEARGLKEPAPVTFPKPDRVLIKVLERRPDGREAIQSIPLDQIHELKPL